MKYLSLMILSAILFSGYRSSENDMNSSSKTASKGWQKLFDGKTTTGWHSYGKKEVGQAWKVSDGALYFDATPNEDSLAPANAFIFKDLVHLVNTFRWK